MDEKWHKLLNLHLQEELTQKFNSNESIYLQTCRLQFKLQGIHL